MRRIILTDKQHIAPFNEPARELRLQNKPLWLWQRDLLAPVCADEREYDGWPTAVAGESSQPMPRLVHRDNLFFNQATLDEFLQRARTARGPVRLAFRANDPAIAAHVLPLTHSLELDGDLVLADIWYLPERLEAHRDAQPLVVDTEARERGYYHVPPYMATELGDLVYQLPRKAFVHVENWVHLFVADILFGVFGRGVTVEERINNDWRFKLHILAHAIYQQKHVLASKPLVTIGRNANIDSTAVIHGPTTIGDNVTIGAGVVIDNCIIGSNVTVSQGCQLMLSVVSDGCFLPFRAALFMTSLMENTMVAQNTCLQLCVVGRDSFIGAGTTFTDFNLLSGPLRTLTPAAGLEETDMLVLGGCVGHHCRLSSGLVVYPARTIESDVVLFGTDERKFITENVSYEASDHHRYRNKYPFPRLYPRKPEPAGEQQVAFGADPLD